MIFLPLRPPWCARSPPAQPEGGLGPLLLVSNTPEDSVRYRSRGIVFSIPAREDGAFLCLDAPIPDVERRGGGGV